MNKFIHLELDLLRALLAVAETSSFTKAALRLMRGQSTISLQIKRLEEISRASLFERSTHNVRLTPAGEELADYARRMLALNDEALSRLSGVELRGTVRLGTPEDFATTCLSDALSEFAHACPDVALEVTCDLTLNLLDGFRSGFFDLVLIKRELIGATGGIRVWREPLVWAAAERAVMESPATLPLVVSPAPCVYRQQAIRALDAIGHSWRIAYSCASLAGSLAALRAGLGVAVLPRQMVPQGLLVADGGRLPALKDTEIALLEAADLGKAATRLRDTIVRSLERRSH